MRLKIFSYDQLNVLLCYLNYAIIINSMHWLSQKHDSLIVIPFSIK